MLRRIVEQQIAWSRAFDRLLPKDMVGGGLPIFKNVLVPSLLKPGLKVMDVGSGRFPLFSAADKSRLKLHVTGLDLNAGELAAAPEGAYDEAIQADITTFTGNGDRDLVICMSVLEHVPDTFAALRALASIVRPGGTVAIFVPSRNAVFARLNLVLPQAVTKELLKYKPKARGGDGWKAYYDRCTPRDFELMARKVGLEPVRTEASYFSSYFQVFTPAFVLWRLWMLGFKAVKGVQAAETFCMEFRRPPEEKPAGRSPAKQARATPKAKPKAAATARQS